MPILEIQFVGEIPKVPNLAQEVADAAGEILMAQKGGTWVKLSCLPANQYGRDLKSLKILFTHILTMCQPKYLLLS